MHVFFIEHLWEKKDINNFELKVIDPLKSGTMYASYLLGLLTCIIHKDREEEPQDLP